MKVYISGAITGTGDRYKEQFKRAEKRLKRAGFKTYNPAGRRIVWKNHVVVKILNYEEIMKKNIAQLMKCDAIVMLSGWKKSKGATFEFKIALFLDYVIYILINDNLTLL